GAGPRRRGGVLGQGGRGNVVAVERWFDVGVLEVAKGLPPLRPSGAAALSDEGSTKL
ncbi:hypothetical protein THAOC_08710, partial [Thalassiosira oceanica]